MKLLHENATPVSLHVFRVTIFGYWLYEIIKDPLQRLQYLPSSVMFYTGFLIRFLPEGLQEALLSPGFLYFLKYGLIFILVCVIFKIAIHVTGLAAALLLSLYQGLIRSFGHMGHTELAMLYAAFMIAIFAFCDWFYKRKEPLKTEAVNLNSIPFVSFVFFFCMIYSFIGIHRLIKGGVEFYQSDILYYWITERVNPNNPENMFLWNFITENHWVKISLRWGLLFMTLVEASAPLILISRKYKYFFVCSMVGMHLLNSSLLHIAFRENMILMILLFDVSRFFKPKAVAHS